VLFTFSALSAFTITGCLSTANPTGTGNTSLTSPNTLGNTSGNTSGTSNGTTTSSSLTASCSVSASNNQVTVSTPLPTGTNVITVTVDGSQCSGNVNTEYANEPCASVTICTPGKTTCSTIKNLLVDTGSYGLRVFSSVLNSAGLMGTQIASGSGKLGECVGFGDGSSEFGPVELFDVTLGGESKISGLPILVINDTNLAGFNNPPSACNSSNSTPDSSPSATGFNGILGVGLFDKDCGVDCASEANNGMYFSCTSSGCANAAVSLTQQVRNPVAALSSDNNGVILMLPPPPNAGAPSLTGALILGIGTKSNNAPANVQAYPADEDGNFTSLFGSFSTTALTSFIDSGSSILFFPWPPPNQPSLASQFPDCTGDSNGFFCPPSEQTLASANSGAGGSPTGCVGFSVANGTTQLNTGNLVFSNLAGPSGTDLSADFDWGLPFFYGRKVYVGIDGLQSTLGTGPYWAY